MNKYIKVTNTLGCIYLIKITSIVRIYENSSKQVFVCLTNRKENPSISVKESIQYFEDLFV